MAQNPFMITPGGDYGPGLRGLSETLGKVGERKKEEEAAQKAIDKFAMIKGKVGEAVRAKDYGKLAELSAEYPELAQSMKVSSGFMKGQEDQQDEEYKNALFSFHNNPTEENAMELLEEKKDMNLPGADTFLERLGKDRDGTIDSVKMDLAVRYPKEWKAMMDATGKADEQDLPTTAMGQYIKKHPDATREDLISFTQDLRPPIEAETDYTLPDAEAEFLARRYIADGKKPFQVRGVEANAKNAQVIQAATKILISEGKEGGESTFDIKDREAIQKSITAQEKTRGSMISFVENMSNQIDHIETIGKELKTFDARMFNKPARWVKKKMAGSSKLAQYEMYLEEITNEIVKLSGGATGSAAQPSEGSREEWSSIIDKNLSIKDMLGLLKEIKKAGNIRMESVNTGLRQTRERLRKVGKGNSAKIPGGVQYREGQTANGPNGPMIFTNGNWEAN